MAQETERRRAGSVQGSPTGRAAALLRAVNQIWHVVEDSSSLVLPLLLFAFKFLEWWYAENKQSAPALPTPPPPRPPAVKQPPKRTPPLLLLLLTRPICVSLSRKVVGEAASAGKNQGECGLCGKRRTNPAMVAGTGYVFCYPCLHASVATHGRCPATGLPASPDSLVKLYETT